MPSLNDSEALGAVGQRGVMAPCLEELRMVADEADAADDQFFLIRPDGKARIPLRNAHHADELAAALRAADPRLAPFSPHPPVSPSARCDAMHAVAEFIAGPG